MKLHRPIMLQKTDIAARSGDNTSFIFHAMAADITKNLSRDGQLVTPQVRFKAANYHDAYDYAVKNFELVDDPLFYAEET